MDLYGQKSKSIPQKAVIHLIEILILWLSYWILFQNGGAWFEKYLLIHNASINTERRIIIFSFNIIVFFRLAFHLEKFFVELPFVEAEWVPVLLPTKLRV